MYWRRMTVYALLLATTVLSSHLVAEQVRPTDEGEPPETASSMDWLFQKRVQHAQTSGGSSEVLYMVREELNEGLYCLAPRRAWYEKMLTYLGEHGGAESLPVLEKWLTRDWALRHFVCAKHDIADTQRLAARSWYAIKDRLCNTREEHVALCLSLLDPTPDTNPLCIHLGEETPGVMEKFPAETRSRLIAVLMDPRRAFYQAPDATVVSAFYLLKLPAFVPTEEETAEIFKHGGSLGKALVATNVVPGSQEAEAFWQECKKSDDPREQLDGFWHFTKDSKGRIHAGALREYLLFLRTICGLPVGEEIESLKCRGLGYLQSYAKDTCMTGEVEVGKFLRWFLQNQPELKWADLLDFWRKPGKRCAVEAHAIIAYRKESRDSAQTALEQWQSDTAQPAVSPDKVKNAQPNQNE